MKPIGLTLKRDGELMIVHECLSCRKISNNRIAGDDLPDSILGLLQEKQNKNLLTIEHRQYLYEALFGKSYEEF